MYADDSDRETVQGHLQSLLTVPATEDPPRRVWRDWVFLGLVLASATAEAIWRPDVIWRWGAFAVCIVSAIGILYRRTYPLTAAVIPFVAFNVAEVTSLIVKDGESVGLYTSAYVLVLVYSVFRWAGGRQMVVMLVVMTIAWTIGWFSADNIPGDIIGAAIVLLFPAVAGLEIRHARQHQRRSIDEARSLEREQIARELHDSVAHHVSAIAIQAQAGLAVSANDPAAARSALEVVEEAAARTLAEMRTMVGALRDDSTDAELTPQSGVRDIARLGHTAPDAPEVRVELHGDLVDLSPPVDAALFRLAQESITNANRHARNATQILVRVDGTDDVVRLDVSDDGEVVSPHIAGPPGYGLLGMAERAKLLGGRFRAGPGSGRGWIVSAELPRAVSS
ncbi:MAG: sensor histidine kinase [Acidimicrobiales bacterium]|nr:sensor histidine kinase [Acidimicrobiales bacterium]